MDIATEISKHEKLIKVLNLVQELDARIESNTRGQQEYFYNLGSTGGWCVQRIAIDTRIKKRLLKYYANQTLSNYEYN